MDIVLSAAVKIQRLFDFFLILVTLRDKKNHFYINSRI